MDGPFPVEAPGVTQPCPCPEILGGHLCSECCLFHIQVMSLCWVGSHPWPNGLMWPRPSAASLEPVGGPAAGCYKWLAFLNFSVPGFQ